MMKERRYLQGIMDGDTTSPFMDPAAYIDAHNVRYGTTEFGGIGAMESILSNKAIVNNSLQPGTNTCIGTCRDEAGQFIYFFIYNSTSYNGIWRYDLVKKVFNAVMLEAIQGVGGTRVVQLLGGFGWTSSTYIHSCRIVGNLLYWVDNIGPRKVNVDAGIKAFNGSYSTTAVAYSLPLNNNEIWLIKYPPSLAPKIQKVYDNTYSNNFIANNSFSFAWQYVWYDNEVTVTSTYSTSSRLNKPTDNFNSITVTMDGNEIIPSSVRMVQLVIRVGSKAYIAKTWDKNVPSEATQIANHNAATPTLLTYQFYNNTSGPYLADANVLKPFDSIPIVSGALEFARNRLFLGNNTSGYDTPNATSLSLTLNSSAVAAGSSLQKNMYQVTLLAGTGLVNYQYRAWYCYLTEIGPAGWYEITSTARQDYVPPLTWAPTPTTVAVSGFTYKGSTENEVQSNIPNNAGLSWYGNNFSLTTNIVTITGTTIAVYDTFKGQSSYQFGVVFYDFALRKCGVVTNNNVRVNIPTRNYAFNTAYNSINWALSNTNAVSEIPSWAYYYAIVRTQNLRTRFFVSSFDNLAKYATKDATGAYLFTATQYSITSAAIAINTTALVQAGLGYVYSAGDICTLIDNLNNVYQLPVIGQSGPYILLKPVDIGDTSVKTYMYEVYTPYQPTDQEPYYEVGQMYKVTSPGDPANRAYSVLGGVLNPDSYILTRNYATNTYLAEGMCPNDLYYQRWDTDAGRVNLITKLGQQVKAQSVVYSNTYIPGTAVNGLSSFDVLNEKTLGKECGPLMKLILTSKVAEEGSVMLAICQLQTNSLYLGETRLIDQTGTSPFTSQSTDVIGTINVLKGSYGTINPEAVVECRGEVYWPDILNGKYIQYGANGLFPISNYKMTRFWKLFSDQWLRMQASDFTALGSRPLIFSTVDLHHKELLITVPQLLATPPAGYLPDYPAMINPFDVFDGQTKTLVFKIDGQPEPHWQGTYRFVPEAYATVNNQLFSFLNGALWIHNQLGSFCNFYGVQYRARIMMVMNQEPNKIKVLNNIVILANKTPAFTYFYCDSPTTQSSDLRDFDWTKMEGVYYCQVYNNKLTPSATGLMTNALISGRKLRSNNFKVLIEYDVTDTNALELQFVQAGYSISRGHTL